MAGHCGAENFADVEELTSPSNRLVVEQASFFGAKVSVHSTQTSFGGAPMASSSVSSGPSQSTSTSITLHSNGMENSASPASPPSISAARPESSLPSLPVSEEVVESRLGAVS